MYQTKISGQGLYRASTQGYGEQIDLFGKTSEGETPMSLVNIALAACVTMCVQGYFARQHGQEDLVLDVSSRYQEGTFQIRLHLAEPLSAGEKEQVLAYISQHCRVKKLLRDDVVVQIDVAEIRE